MIIQKLWEYQGHLDWSIHKKKSPHLSEKTGSKRMIRPAFVFPAGQRSENRKRMNLIFFSQKILKFLVRFPKSQVFGQITLLNMDTLDYRVSE